MIFLIAYIAFSLNLLNLSDKPVELSNNQIYIIISGPSCHECLEKTNQWIGESDLGTTAVIWYNKTIIQKKEQIRIYKEFITPKTWTFSKDLNQLNKMINLEQSPNIIVVKDGEATYFPYSAIFSNDSRVAELKKLIE